MRMQVRLGASGERPLCNSPSCRQQRIGDTPGHADGPVVVSIIAVGEGNRKPHFEIEIGSPIAKTSPGAGANVNRFSELVRRSDPPEEDPILAASPGETS